jgi:phage-related protein
MPQSKAMPSIGPRCGELRVRDVEHNWRIIYRVDDDAILVVDVFPKKTPRTPPELIERCRKRLSAYDEAKKKVNP